jgi:hypothetical protein
LREEAIQCAAEGTHVECVKVTLSDAASTQQVDLLKDAIKAITKAYKKAK